MGLSELLTEEEQAELLQLAGEVGDFQRGEFVSASKGGTRAEMKLLTWGEKRIGGVSLLRLNNIVRWNMYQVLIARLGRI